jgi:hypothetical protein
MNDLPMPAWSGDHQVAVGVADVRAAGWPRSTIEWGQASVYLHLLRAPRSGDPRSGVGRHQVAIFSLDLERQAPRPLASDSGRR